MSLEVDFLFSELPDENSAQLTPSFLPHDALSRGPSHTTPDVRTMELWMNLDFLFFVVLCGKFVVLVQQTEKRKLRQKGKQNNFYPIFVCLGCDIVLKLVLWCPCSIQVTYRKVSSQWWGDAAGGNPPRMEGWFLRERSTSILVKSGDKFQSVFSP